jgi:hypothetical protein
MSVHLRIRSAASFAHDLVRKPVPTFRDHAFARQRGVLRVAAIGLLAALAANCSAVTASPHRGPDPSDPSARVPPASYRSTIAGYASQRPVEPRSWREQNERVAPAPK